MLDIFCNIPIGIFCSAVNSAVNSAVMDTTTENPAMDIIDIEDESLKSLSISNAELEKKLAEAYKEIAVLSK